MKIDVKLREGHYFNENNVYLNPKFQLYIYLKSETKIMTLKINQKKIKEKKNLGERRSHIIFTLIINAIHVIDY